jgi:hypothetical protein
MRRVQILKAMHMGPIKKDIKKGDIIDWDSTTKYFTLNGNTILQDKNVNVEEAIAILDRQRLSTQSEPWSAEIEIPNVNPSDYLVKTDTQVIFPILGCMKAAENYMTEDSHWFPKNEEQYQFLKEFGLFKEDVAKLGKNIVCKASKEVDVINDFLKKNGFDIELSPVGEKGFAVASILNVLVEWVEAGKKTSILNKNGTFPAVSLKADGVSGPRMYLNQKVHPYPVVEIKTKSGDIVYMTVMDFMRGDLFSISEKVEKLNEIGKMTDTEDCACTVIFPMVDYNQKVDISWLKGLTLNDYTIGEAFQQTKFRMNEIGARAESAVAMGFRCMCLDKEREKVVLIDKPFLLWIRRDGIDLPLFSGIFAEDVWKAPADLGKDIVE